MPHLRIRPTCEDICNECFAFKNRFKYKSFRADSSLGVEWWEKFSSNSSMSSLGEEETNNLVSVGEDSEEQ